MNKVKLINITKIKETINKLDCLNQAEAIGIFGSLARGEFSKKSDIDIFVVVEEKTEDIELFWYNKLREALSWTDREITVIIYSVKGLKKISNWYVLRLAKEGILLYDKGGKIKNIFAQILKKAQEVGVQEYISEDGYKYFGFEKIDLERPKKFRI